MAVIGPLRALHYDPPQVGDVGRVLAPPYDVISPAEQEALYASSPYNVVRLILPQEPDRARVAAERLRAWVERHVLVREQAPAVYLYAQPFRLPDGSLRQREGVLCRLRLEDFSAGVVRPHERTLPGPKADRLALLRATGANLSPIFGLYGRRGERLRDLLGASIATEPWIDAIDAAGARHLVWQVADPAAIARVQAALSAEPIFIADGHHRYETALAYRDERPGSEDAAYVLAYLANMEEEGVVILPTHRLLPRPLRLPSAELVRQLAADFSVETLGAGQLRRDGDIDCVLPDRRLRLRPRPSAIDRLTDLSPTVRRLDVALLHGLVLRPLLGLEPEQLTFTHDDDEAVGAVTRGEAAAAFLLNPPTMAEVREVCLAGDVMPQKSTYFYPKLATGIVLNLVGPPWV